MEMRNDNKYNILQLSPSSQQNKKSIGLGKIYTNYGLKDKMGVRPITNEKIEEFTFIDIQSKKFGP